jgi:hypothetical protein
VGYLGSDRKPQIARVGVVLPSLTTMLIKPLCTKKMMTGHKGVRMGLRYCSLGNPFRGAEKSLVEANKCWSIRVMD